MGGDVADTDSIISSTWAGGGRAKIGTEQYRVLILPGVRTVSLAAYRQIEKLAEDGMRVIAVGAVPENSAEHGADDPEVISISRKLFGPRGTGILVRSGSAMMANLRAAARDDVPAGFASRYPDTPILEGEWSGTTSSFMAPSSSLSRKVCRAFLEEYSSRYGNDHLYVLADLSETAIKGSDEAKRKYVLDLPRVNFEVIREIDPQGIGLLQGSTFLGKEWPAARARECIQQLPAESIRVVDFWAERQPLYKQMDYFAGTPWIFGILNSFGGDAHLHGDMRMLGKQMKTVSQDAQARKCTGFALVNEVSGDFYRGAPAAAPELAAHHALSAGRSHHGSPIRAD